MTENEEPIELRFYVKWPNIAKYLGVTVQTARRWKNECGLPIIYNPSKWPVLYVSMFHEWQKLRNEKNKKNKKR